MSVPSECLSATEEFFRGPGATGSSAVPATTSATATVNATAVGPHHENGNAATVTATHTNTADVSPVVKSPPQASPARSAPPPAPCTLSLKPNTTASSLSSAAAEACATNGSGASSGTTVNTVTATTTTTAEAVISGASCQPISSDSVETAAATSTAAADPAASNSSSTPIADLLRWKDMPRHLQFNRYIVEGYRPLTDAKGCVHSLFYFHNETVNILTHGIPVLYILATVPYLLPWDDFRWLSWCHLLGTLAPWCGSFVYHLFMNLDQGEVVYYRLLKLDMFGIWMSQSFGAITFVTATAFCWKLRTLVIGGYCILCLWGLYKALLADSPWQRRLCFLFPFVMRLHLVVLRMMKMAGGNTESMVHVYLQDGVSIVGGAIGAMNIPEKWLPGNVDFFLNSHNIMHVLVVVAVYSMHQASMRDMEWMSKSGCNGIGPANDSIPLDVLGGLHHTEL